MYFLIPLICTFYLCLVSYLLCMGLISQLCFNIIVPVFNKQIQLNLGDDIITSLENLPDKNDGSQKTASQKNDI